MTNLIIYHDGELELNVSIQNEKVFAFSKIDINPNDITKRA